MVKRKNCAVIGCQSNTINRRDLTFYKFPQHETDRHKMWMRLCCRPNTKTKIPLICALHFAPCDINYRRRLIPDAIPSLFLPSTDDLKCDIVKPKKEVKPNRIPVPCVFRNCPNLQSLSPDKRFFRFPKRDTDAYQRWADACQLNQYQRCLKSLLVCSDHFERHEYGKRTLFHHFPTPRLLIGNNKSINHGQEPPPTDEENGNVSFDFKEVIVEPIDIIGSLNKSSTDVSDPLAHPDEPSDSHSSLDSFVVEVIKLEPTDTIGSTCILPPAVHDGLAHPEALSHRDISNLTFCFEEVKVEPSYSIESPDGLTHFCESNIPAPTHHDSHTAIQYNQEVLQDNVFVQEYVKSRIPECSSSTTTSFCRHCPKLRRQFMNERRKRIKLISKLKRLRRNLREMRKMDVRLDDE